jgi:small subunit ribosomal protein S16
MAVKIRLTRTGKKKQPTYRVVVMDGRKPRDGKYIEQIGRYDARQEPSLIEIDNERALDWLHKGAQPTERARKLLEISGAWAQFRVDKGEIHTIGEHQTKEWPGKVHVVGEPEEEAEEVASDQLPVTSSEEEEVAGDELPVASSEEEEVAGEGVASDQLPVASSEVEEASEPEPPEDAPAEDGSDTEPAQEEDNE